MQEFELLEQALEGNYTQEVNEFLAQLEDISLTYSKMSNSEITALLNKMPKLKYLYLSGREYKLDLDFNDMINFEFLEELYLSSTYIDSPDLTAFLNKTSILKFLDLSNCNSLLNCNFDDLKNLDFLEVLNLCNSKMNFPALIAFLNKTTKLKTLYPPDRRNLKNCKFVELEPIGSLERLVLGNGTVINGQVEVEALLIKKAPKLHNNKDLLLEYLKRLTEYHPAVAYIAKLLVEKNYDSLTPDEFKQIFSASCSYPTKLKMLLALPYENATQIAKFNSCIEGFTSLKEKIEQVEQARAEKFILGKNQEAGKMLPEPTAGIGSKILSFLFAKFNSGLEASISLKEKIEQGEQARSEKFILGKNQEVGKMLPGLTAGVGLKILNFLYSPEAEKAYAKEIRQLLEKELIKEKTEKQDNKQSPKPQ